MLHRYAFRYLFNYIVEEDILRTKDGVEYFLNSKKLSEEQLREIRRGAKVLKKSLVLKLLFKEIRFIAQKRMFEESGNETDLLFGKGMLYNIDVIEKKINTLSNLHIKKK